jgi:hypothetical protein
VLVLAAFAADDAAEVTAVLVEVTPVLVAAMAVRPMQLMVAMAAAADARPSAAPVSV